MSTTPDKSSSERWAHLDPDLPGLDEETRLRRRALAEMRKMSREEYFQLCVRAGIYTPDGKLTEPYQGEPEPSPYRGSY
jgi:hypothetical protein